MRKLATIRTVESVNPIEGADRIEYITMKDLGWKVVVGKGEVKVGDLIVYFEIDSALQCIPIFDFLKDRCYKRWTNVDGAVVDECYRIKTAKLRGIVSQGLVIPLSKFYAGPASVHYDDGDDMTGVLGVRHYDEIKEKFAPVSGVAKGAFPSAWIPKTDEERVQNLMWMFSDPECAETEYEVTEKVDGSSLTVAYSPSMRPENPFFVCSRNQELEYDQNTKWCVALARDGVLDKLIRFYNETGFEYAFQGELVGPGFNGNRDAYPEQHWKIFKVWDVKNQKYLTPETRQSVCARIGLEHVNVLKCGWKAFKSLDTLDKMLEFAKGKTALGHEREGVVFKSMDGNYSFKCINNKYLLNEAD